MFVTTKDTWSHLLCGYKRKRQWNHLSECFHLSSPRSEECNNSAELDGGHWKIVVPSLARFKERQDNEVPGSGSGPGLT